MQTQQQKPAPQQNQATAPCRRVGEISAGEIVVAGLNLNIGGMGAWSTFDLLIHSVDSPQYLLPGGTGALGAFGALLASLLIVLRQRRLATYAQWLSAIGALAMFGVIAWKVVTDLSHWREYLVVLPLLVIAVLFGWFAWFLKRMDDSK
jgi:hypothetical protein